MTISPEIESLLNAQIAMELYASHAYLCMASYFSSNDYAGFAHYFVEQSKEEQEHALKLFKFLHDVNGQYKPVTNACPPVLFNSMIEALQGALENEVKVSQNINQIISKTMEAKDYATYTFLEWFVKEQVEEEAQMESLIKKLQKFGNDQGAIYRLDRELLLR